MKCQPKIEMEEMLEGTLGVLKVISKNGVEQVKTQAIT